VIGRGATLAEAFVQTAEATFALMCDTDAVQPMERIDVEFTEADPELALVTWLNLLLAHANARGSPSGGSRWRRTAIAGAAARAANAGMRTRTRHAGEGRDADGTAGGAPGRRLGNALRGGPVSGGWTCRT